MGNRMEIRGRRPGSHAGATSSAEMEALHRHSSPVELQENEVLLQEGHESDAVFLVTEGVLAASVSESGQTRELGEIGVGQWIGEVSMLSPGPATATVVAKSTSRLLRLDREGFEALLRERPALANSVLRSLCRVLVERLRATGALVFSDERTERDGGAREAGGEGWFLKAYRKLLGVGEGAS